jgi:hypothetical protein
MRVGLGFVAVAAPVTLVCHHMSGRARRSGNFATYAKWCVPSRAAPRPLATVAHPAAQDRTIRLPTSLGVGFAWQHAKADRLTVARRSSRAEQHPSPASPPLFPLALLAWIIGRHAVWHILGGIVSAAALVFADAAAAAAAAEADPRASAPPLDAARLRVLGAVCSRGGLARALIRWRVGVVDCARAVARGVAPPPTPWSTVTPAAPSRERHRTTDTTWRSPKRTKIQGLRRGGYKELNQPLIAAVLPTAVPFLRAARAAAVRAT